VLVRRGPARQVRGRGAGVCGSGFAGGQSLQRCDRKGSRRPSWSA